MASLPSLRCGPCSFEPAPSGTTTTVSGLSTLSACCQVMSDSRIPRGRGCACVKPPGRITVTARVDTSSSTRIGSSPALTFVGPNRTRLYTETMSDWDAAKYHRISDPQLSWGRVVAERLAPAAGERILDVGCGTGRLTEEIARTPGITVVGLDRSASMLRQAGSRGETPV